MITRFSVLPDERRLLLGIDKANIFKAGVVYEVEKIMGQIIFRPIGDYALAKKLENPCELSQTDDIIISGHHLITKEEQEKLK